MKRVRPQPAEGRGLHKDTDTPISLYPCGERRGIERITKISPGMGRRNEQNEFHFTYTVLLFILKEHNIKLYE